jgi:hypothetical protein
VELTDDEVVALIEKLGFDIEKREFGITASYIGDPKSMLFYTLLALSNRPRFSILHPKTTTTSPSTTRKR